MQEILVNKEALLGIVEENMEEHREIYENALESYKIKVVETLEKLLAAAKEGKNYRPVFNLVHPINYLKEYEQIIVELEMSIEKEIKLTSTEFKNYVMDQWSWTNNFTASNMCYTEMPTKYTHNNE